jgi:putative redox protein
MTKLGNLLKELRSIAEAGDPALCSEPMAGVTRQVDGFRCDARFGDLEMTIDEPVSFGGTGLAPNPAEVALAALGASLQVTLTCYAEYLGMPVRDISVNLSGALDSRGFFGTDASIPAGFSTINVHIGFQGENAQDKLAQLISHVERCCPVLAVFRQPMDVSLSYEQEKA